jgi:NADP-dependent 3-hydroxy acid dehydrogenase YdfG
MSKEDLEKARSDAEYILTLADTDVADLFYRETMRRSLSRTVRRLDKLILNGGADRKLGERALARLGFAPIG